MDKIKHLEGIGGSIDLFNDKVVINYKGLLRGLKGSKTLYFDSITSIQIKEPGILRGRIRFGVPGDASRGGYYLGSMGNKGTSGVFVTPTDDNLIVFSKSELENALFIKEFIENKKRHKTSGSSISVADELKKLSELLKEGIITQEDFDSQKNKLIS